MITTRQATTWASAILLAGLIQGCSSMGGYQSTASSTDSQLTASVRQALNSRPALRASNVQVATQNSQVHLSGTVDTPVERTDAAQVAASVPGVSRVVNNLSVAGDGG